MAIKEGYSIGAFHIAKAGSDETWKHNERIIKKQISIINSSSNDIAKYDIKVGDLTPSGVLIID